MVLSGAMEGGLSTRSASQSEEGGGQWWCCRRGWPSLLRSRDYFGDKATEAARWSFSVAASGAGVAPSVASWPRRGWAVVKPLFRHTPLQISGWRVWLCMALGVRGLWRTGSNKPSEPEQGVFIFISMLVFDRLRSWSVSESDGILMAVEDWIAGKEEEKGPLYLQCN